MLVGQGHRRSADTGGGSEDAREHAGDAKVARGGAEPEIGERHRDRGENRYADDDRDRPWAGDGDEDGAERDTRYATDEGVANVDPVDRVPVANGHAHRQRQHGDHDRRGQEGRIGEAEHRGGEHAHADSDRRLHRGADRDGDQAGGDDPPLESEDHRASRPSGGRFRRRGGAEAGSSGQWCFG